jgi:hypothetical protein
MKKLFFLLMVVFISAVSVAQVRAKVVIGTQQTRMHRHYTGHGHYYTHRHYVQPRKQVHRHRSRYNQPAARIIIKGRL